MGGVVPVTAGNQGACPLLVFHRFARRLWFGCGGRACALVVSPYAASSAWHISGVGTLDGDMVCKAAHKAGSGFGRVCGGLVGSAGGGGMSLFVAQWAGLVSVRALCTGMVGGAAGETRGMNGGLAIPLGELPLQLSESSGECGVGIAGIPKASTSVAPATSSVTPGIPTSPWLGP